jgi:hypothetical protein
VRGDVSGEPFADGMVEPHWGRRAPTHDYMVVAVETLSKQVARSTWPRYRFRATCRCRHWASTKATDDRQPYPGAVTAAHDYSDLHQLIDRLEPEQAAEIKEHARRLVGGGAGRFRVLTPFDGPATDLGAQAKQLVGAEIDQAGR